MSLLQYLESSPNSAPQFPRLLENIATTQWTMLVMLSLLSSSTSSSLLSLSRKLCLQTLTRTFSRRSSSSSTTMAINLQSHAFAGNPLRSKTPKPEDPLSPITALETLKTQLLDANPHHQLSSPSFKVLPFRKGRPLAASGAGPGDSSPNWHLGWISLADCKGYLANSGVELSGDSMVYLGSRPEEDVVYWAIDVSGEGGLVPEFWSKQLCFVELRTLMVATDWADARAMGELSVAGHVSGWGYLVSL